jgi:DNA polymerase III subunit epsilon
MREIVLDTETTGMDPVKGDRLVEIGCVELMNHLPTGRTYHVYLNPERDIPAEATAVHGITNEFVKDKPTFGEAVGDFMNFIGDARLVIHNAEFDLKFLNAELKTFGFPSLDAKRTTDTVRMAREKFPGSPANLDALCRRFGIDNSSRTYHGALLDSQLLAEVYLELLGGRQRGLAITPEKIREETATHAAPVVRIFRTPRDFPASVEEVAAHEAMMKALTK